MCIVDDDDDFTSSVKSRELNFQNPIYYTYFMFFVKKFTFSSSTTRYCLQDKCCCCCVVLCSVAVLYTLRISMRIAVFYTLHCY